MTLNDLKKKEGNTGSGELPFVELTNVQKFIRDS